MAIGGFGPDNTSTVPSWIVAGKELVMSRDTLMMKVNESGVIYPYQSLTTRFGGLLNRYIIEYEFDSEEWDKYIYQPKRFCKDWYGTPELWGDILYINHMVSAVDFNTPRVKIFNESILEAIAELQAIYADDLAKNQLEVKGGT
ncbi:MAG: hypothetical protein NC548_38945 [Lachnospiraceae bacterium]|nr:hypothetical protein [Lachnospiraceae bacterium]